jgi:hypothetical protein
MSGRADDIYDIGEAQLRNRNPQTPCDVSLEELPIPPEAFCSNVGLVRSPAHKQEVATLVAMGMLMKSITKRTRVYLPMISPVWCLHDPYLTA